MSLESFRLRLDRHSLSAAPAQASGPARQDLAEPAASAWAQPPLQALAALAQEQVALASVPGLALEVPSLVPE